MVRSPHEHHSLDEKRRRNLQCRHGCKNQLGYRTLSAKCSISTSQFEQIYPSLTSVRISCTKSEIASKSIKELQIRTYTVHPDTSSPLRPAHCVNLDIKQDNNPDTVNLSLDHNTVQIHQNKPQWCKLCSTMLMSSHELLSWGVCESVWWLQTFHAEVTLVHNANNEKNSLTAVWCEWKNSQRVLSYTDFTNNHHIHFCFRKALFFSRLLIHEGPTRLIATPKLSCLHWPFLN